MIATNNEIIREWIIAVWQTLSAIDQYHPVTRLYPNYSVAAVAIEDGKLEIDFKCSSIGISSRLDLASSINERQNEFPLSAC